MGSKQQSQLSLPILVLDLDETLIHSVSYTKTDGKAHPDCAFSVATPNGSSGGTDYFSVFARPGLASFLETASKRFQLVVFTAGTKPYVDAILEAIDPKGYIGQRWYRDSCSDHWTVRPNGKTRGHLAKDLHKVTTDMSQVALVDNYTHSFSLQLDNGMLIRPWKQDTTDRELRRLSEYLAEPWVQKCPDMRVVCQMWEPCLFGLVR